MNLTSSIYDLSYASSILVTKKIEIWVTKRTQAKVFRLSLCGLTNKLIVPTDTRRVLPDNTWHRAVSL